jgi:TolB protein
MSPDGSVIVYASPRTGHGDIYQVSKDGSNTVKLTTDTNYEGDPSFSPNGKKIVFVREQDGIGHIWIMNADGSNQKQLTSGPAYDHGPSVSPDGSRIVFTRQVVDWRFPPSSPASAEIFVMNIDGTGQTGLTNNEKADWQASFSPDGERIVYSIWSKEIWVMHKDGSNPRRLGSGSSPAFSPNGKQILFLSGEYGREISIMNADGTGSKQVYRSDNYKSRPTFCLGGSAISFLEQPESRGVGYICIMNADGSNLERITQTD